MKRLALVIAIGVLVVVAGALVAVSSGDSDTADTTSARLPVGTISGGNGFVYVAGDALPRLGGTSAVHEIDTERADVEDLAGALGMDGEITGDGVDERFHLLDEPAQMDAGGGGWSYACCEAGPDEPWTGELPSEDEARDTVLSILRDAGYDVDGADVDVERSGDAWSVDVAPLVDGRWAQGHRVSLSVKPGGTVNDGGGSSVVRGSRREVELVDTVAAVDALNRAVAPRPDAVEVVLDSAELVYAQTWPGDSGGDPEFLVPAYRMSGRDASGAAHTALALAVDPTAMSSDGSASVVVGSLPRLEGLVELASGQPEIGTAYAGYLITHCFWVAAGETLWLAADSTDESIRAVGDGVFTRLDADSARFHAESGQAVELTLSDATPPFGCA
jgi:hypothetical protein